MTVANTLTLIMAKDASIIDFKVVILNANELDYSLYAITGVLTNFGDDLITINQDTSDENKNLV